MNTVKPKTITTWPPAEPVRQVTMVELKAMSPDAINTARAAGALDQLMKTGQDAE